ncbi:hypothetical protein DAPPUDRAFT_111719, partial [Daphnia pulex]
MQLKSYLSLSLLYKKEISKFCYIVSRFPGVLQWPTAKGAAAGISTQFSETLASLWPTRTAGFAGPPPWGCVGRAHSDNIEAAGHPPPPEDNNRQQNQQQLVNRRRRQRQAVVAAAGPVNRHNNNNVAVAHPRNNEQEPQAPERQQRNRRWMANGQHSTWFQ